MGIIVVRIIFSNGATLLHHFTKGVKVVDIRRWLMKLLSPKQAVEMLHVSGKVCTDYEQLSRSTVLIPKFSPSFVECTIKHTQTPVLPRLSHSAVQKVIEGMLFNPNNSNIHKSCNGSRFLNCNNWYRNAQKRGEDNGIEWTFAPTDKHIYLRVYLPRTGESPEFRTFIHQLGEKLRTVYVTNNDREIDCGSW